MKKVVFLITVMTFTLLACNKDDDSENKTFSDNHTENAVMINETKSPVGNLTSMSDDDFADALFDLYLEYGNEGALSILFDEDGNLIHDYEPDFEGDPGAFVCEGNGASFARCVKNWLEAHPGDCLKITYDDGSDTFSADDDC